MISPPFTKLVIDGHVEGLLGGRGFCKCVAGVSTEDSHTIDGSEGPKDSSTRLFHASGICVGESDSFAESFASITGATGFGFIVFDNIGPDKWEDSGVAVRAGTRGVEHGLVLVAIELFPFGGTPFLEVRTFLEDSAGETSLGMAGGDSGYHCFLRNGRRVGKVGPELGVVIFTKGV